MARSITTRAVAAVACCCGLLAAAPAANAVPPVSVTPPELNRSPGSRTVTTTTGSWAPPDNSYSYRWLRCASPDVLSCLVVVPVVTASSYVLRTADIGRYIRSEVTASNEDATDNQAVRTSDPEGPIAASPPVNTVLPKVTGTPLRELALGTTAGTWTGRVAGDPAFTYQWQRCTSKTVASCSSISGATSTTYLMRTADVGRFMRVVVGAEGLGRAQVGAPNVPVGPVQDLQFGTGPDDPPADPPNRSGFKRLRPFPVLVVAGRLRGGRTRISDFVVRGPRRAKVSVRCKGRGCPFGRIGGTIGKSKRLRFRRAQRTFRAGQVLEIRVTGRNRIGKFVRITFRRASAPRRSDLCLVPAAKRPSRC